jgi:hypothetical protein
MLFVGGALFLVEIARAGMKQRAEALAELLRRESFDLEIALGNLKPLFGQDVVPPTEVGFVVVLNLVNRGARATFEPKAQWIVDDQPLGDPSQVNWAQSRDNDEFTRELGTGSPDSLHILDVLESKQTPSGWLAYPRLPGALENQRNPLTQTYTLRSDHKDPLGTAIHVWIWRLDRDAARELQLGFRLEGNTPVPFLL